MTITILSWQRYQTNSTRVKHWLKLHTQLLHSPDIMDGLTASGRWVWLGLLLLALTREGQVAGSASFIARQLGVRPSLLAATLTKLISLNLIQVEEGTSSRAQLASASDSSATHTPLEREREKKKEVFSKPAHPSPLRATVGYADHSPLPSEQRAVLTERMERYRKNVGRAPSTEIIAKWCTRLAQGERL